MDLKELKNLVNQVLEENASPKQTLNEDRSSDYFQLGFGYEEQPHLTDEEKKDLDLLLRWLDTQVGIEPHQLKNLLTPISKERTIDTWIKIKNRLSADPEAQASRERGAAARYPKGSRAGD